MTDQATKAAQFAQLHQKGNPVIIYNAWDAGSAKAIVESGAKAIATGDHPVGFAHGFNDDDFDDFTFETYLVTIKEIAKRIDVPFSVDISNAEGLDDQALKDRITTLLEVGVVGINFEDRGEDGVVPAGDHAARIKVVREAAHEFGVELFINARSDIFAGADPSEHEGLIDEAVERAQAYKEAGANGFFVPALMENALIARLTERSPLPVNIIRLPGAPSTSELVEAGISRISYGPVVQAEMIEWLKGKAKEAFTV